MADFFNKAFWRDVGSNVTAAGIVAGLAVVTAGILGYVSKPVVAYFIAFIIPAVGIPLILTQLAKGAVEERPQIPFELTLLDKSGWP